MTRRSLCGALAGAAVALLVPLAAGCSSPCGGRACRKESVGLAPAPPPTPAQPVAVVGPATPPGTPAAAAAAYGGQKKCPVMGEELGAMGDPVPVTVRGQTVYVCCRGCAAKAQRDPDKTLAAVAADRAGR